MGGVDNDAFENTETAENNEISDRTNVSSQPLLTDDKSALSHFVEAHKGIINKSIAGILALLYHAYFIYCIARHYEKDIPIWSCSTYKNTDGTPYWCGSIAFLILITIFAWAGVLYGYVLRPYLGSMAEKAFEPVKQKFSDIIKIRAVSIGLYFLPILGMVIFVVADCFNYDAEDNLVIESRRLVSLAGGVVLILIAVIFSTNRRKIRWRHSVWGFTLQFVFALLVLRWDMGQQIIQCLSSKVTTFLGFTDYGSVMVYGYLIDDRPFISSNLASVIKNETLLKQAEELLEAINDSGSFGGGGNPFMFKVLSLIFFLSFFVSMLYYWGVLQFIVLKLGWLLYISVGTTAAESMNAAANIFLGQTEAPLLIKPFLPIMTKSEIHAVMTGGFATIAGTVLGAYIGIGIDPSDLITASVMAAPTSLAISKLFYPETEESKTTINDIKVEKGDDANVLDAAAKGASQAIMLVLNIGASLIAFKAFVAFLDAIVAWFGIFAGVDDLSFQLILGYLFWPLAFIMGIRPEDCLIVSKLIGMKLLVTELPAFKELAAIKDACEAGNTEECTLESRSITVATYALCGFANFASIGIQIGGLSAMAPERKSDFAQIVLRAMIAGCWVSFMNACVAGALLDK